MTGIERDKLTAAINNPEKVWDVIIIGGGATGLGAALDAASRGLQVLLLEQADFAKGTSSRSTKLVHGGVRYLAQGDISLVMEALYERGLLLKNAAHLVKNESFIIPNYQWWGGAFYTIGLTIYDVLAGRLGFGRAKHISKQDVIKRLGTIQQNGLHGGVVYHDGQFDDARLAINLAQTCLEQGAIVLNYFRVTGLTKNAAGEIAGLVTTDMETGASYILKAKTVVNATGVFVDDILNMDEKDRKPLVKPSQGVHLVLERSFMPGEDALMIPKTDDGRVLFAVPWHDKLVVGTTDTPVDTHSLEPVALQEEIEFIMRTAGKYLNRQPEAKDVLSIFAGLRPLAAPESGSSKTKEISRSHKLIVSKSGLVTITGGKWTTYRRMGEDTIDKAIAVGKLTYAASKTKQLTIHGSEDNVDRNDHLYVYGSDKTALIAVAEESPGWSDKLHPRLPYIKAEVIWGIRQEMARTVEDILARRTRALFLDARAAIDMAPVTAALMAAELGESPAWEQEQVQGFTKTAQAYLLQPYLPKP